MIILIFILTIFFLIFFEIKSPVIKIGKLNFEPYYLVALFGVLLLFTTKIINFNDLNVFFIFDGSNPFGILILFLSMVFISIFLDEVGFIEYCAKLAVKYSKSSGKKLFFLIYFFVAILTIFTSNDIIIITLTPFIYYFAKHTKLNPLPLLLSEFFAANTWSMMLYIGNPTNIYVASHFNIKFLEYTKHMIIPTIFSGITGLILLYYIFRKEVNVTIKKESIHPEESLKDKTGSKIGVLFLLFSILGMAISPYFNIEMWKISLFSALILALIVNIRDKINKTNFMKESLSKIPFGIIPFLISFFIIEEALTKNGLTKQLYLYISNITRNSLIMHILLYGLLSAISANLMNNIPMTIAFSSVISHLENHYLFFSSLSVIIGSNIGANFTPIGALAGIMWLRILRNKKFKITFFEFMKYGISINLITLLIALISLFFISFFF